MLKKAGIVVAAAAAGLLAVSPLAFAGDSGKDHGHSVTNNNTNGDESGGLVNVADNNLNVPIQACDNQVPVNVLGVQVPLNDTSILADLSGALGLGLLGAADVDTADSGDNSIDDSCNQESASGDVHAQD